jgi:hypothetical protein
MKGRYDGGEVFLRDDSTTKIVGQGKVKLNLMDGRIIKPFVFFTSQDWSEI